MAKQEFTKKELSELLNNYEVDGKISFNDLGEIIFDSKFPDELFQNAKEQIIKARDDQRRYKELADILLKKTQTAYKIQTQIVALSEERVRNIQTILNLKETINKIENEIIPLEVEFNMVKARIDEISKD